MLDRFALPILKAPLNSAAQVLDKKGVRADSVTVVGFVIGMLAIPALLMQFYFFALILILINRLCDGLDGALARKQGASDAGGYLDIVLDFIFYSGVVFGFALANPEQNALAACGLILSFMGTGSSFLAFAIMAERKNIKNMHYPSKGFYYLGGIAEGTETIGVFIALCLFPTYFAVISWSFALICAVTTVTRIVGGYYSIRRA
jgi:phosphatidylglycerophosphate synthase